MASKKNKNKRRQLTQGKRAQRKQRKLHQQQKADVANFVSNIAANSAGAGLIGIAVTKGDNIGISIGVGLIGLGLALQLLSLIIKR
ncbi:TPA: hypothetical protein ACGSTL_001360 [Vibrio parahaemolyticus]|uniref:hypothetical protein n=1 Tax=Vibrio campbellii TaxID=680 RepID=UPI001F0876F2|nr:hypothetical protein [Vibrio campbellii]UMM06805.1 hypothetical protein MKR81_26455 [Vibrio campbellii]